MRTPGRFAVSLLCGAFALTLANCSANDPMSVPATPYSLSRVSARHDLVACPGGDDGAIARATIGPAGGRLALGGFVMDVPAGAVLDTTTFVMRVPESKVLKVKIRARDAQHYLFAKPVTITLDYSRCGSLPSDPTAWYVDEGNDGMLEQMPGLNNPSAKSYTLETGHLSGYALAN